MALTLHNLKPKKGSKKTKKRVGRGNAGSGTYSGRGLKGQRSRSGGRSGLKLKGLRTMMLSQPKKRGFKSGRTPAAIVNLSDLNKVFANGAKVNPKAIQKKGLVEDISAGVKILAKGDIGVKLTIEDCKISEAAKQKIEKAGGKIL
jgi:large subunit ribosomal protein L15